MDNPALPDRAEHKKSDVVNAIKRNLRLLNFIVLVVVYVFLLLNIRFISSALNYIPPVSIIAMLSIVSGLIVASLYLAGFISKNAIQNIEEYDNKLNTLLISLQQEVTVRREAEEAIEQQALYDNLTNLPNRALFTRHLRRMITRLEHHKNYIFAVLFIDIDYFKVVNDSLGHSMGDHLLINVAQRLQSCIRTVDMVARFGGDEFAVLLDDINDITDALRVAERIKKELVLPFNLSGHEVFTTASIGIALSTTDYKQEEDVLRDADIAMYHAKSLGRARYEIFDTRMRDTAMKRLQIEAELRQAIERKEFLIHYQPIVSVTSGSITGVEALVRWHHPEKGLTLPKEFIQVAEDTGLIGAIGEWVLRVACTQHREWQKAGYSPLRMEVNFSSRQFWTQNLPQLIGGILQETGMDASYLGIEITESIAMEDHSIGVLNELTAMGIQTSIDDFGTGYSSLGSLKRFPINAIKVDRSFVKDITVDPDAEAIVTAIIAMAHSLKMKVVAEGVETKEQLTFLQACRCDEAQGNFLYPPVTDRELTKFLKEGQK